MHESEQRRRLSLPAARAAPPASLHPFPQPDPSPRSPSSSASLFLEARPTGAPVEPLKATEMSLRAFEKSGSGRRAGNASCENTNLARGSSNFCCRRLELCFVSAANKYGSAMRNQTLGCFFSYARAASRDNRYFILELHKSLLYAFSNMISSSQGEDTVGKKLVATPPSPGRPPF